MVVLRRGGAAEGVVVIEHALTTPLDLVAGQVWRGSLVLADYFLNNVQQEDDSVFSCLGGQQDSRRTA